MELRVDYPELEFKGNKEWEENKSAVKYFWALKEES